MSSHRAVRLLVPAVASVLPWLALLPGAEAAEAPREGPTAVAAVDYYRWPLAHTGYYPDRAIRPRPELHGKYGLLNAGIHSASKSSPVVHEGVVYVGADTGRLHALDAGTLDPIWSFDVRPQAAFGIHGTPAVDGERVYIGGYDGYLYALDRADGRLAWQTKLGDSIGASPVIHGDRILVGVESRAPDGWLAVVDRETGEELVRSAPFGDHTHATPTIDADTGMAYLGANSEYFFAVDPADGSIAWRQRTFGAIKSTAALFEDSVLVTSWDSRLYRLDKTDGSVVWEVPTGARSMSSPTVDTDARRVYFGSHDGHLYAVDFDSGETIWRFRSDARILSSATVAADATNASRKLLVVGSADGNVYWLDAQTGEALNRAPTQGKITSVPTVEGGRVYVSGNDGWLYVFE